MISTILWVIFGCVVGGIIGSFLGGILGTIVSIIDGLLDMLPIPVQITRLVLAFGTCFLVHHYCDSKLYFGLTVAWWAFYLYCVFSADEVGN